MYVSGSSYELRYHRTYPPMPFTMYKLEMLLLFQVHLLHPPLFLIPPAAELWTLQPRRLQRIPCPFFCACEFGHPRLVMMAEMAGRMESCYMLINDRDGIKERSGKSGRGCRWLLDIACLKLRDPGWEKSFVRLHLQIFLLLFKNPL